MISDPDKEILQTVYDNKTTARENLAEATWELYAAEMALKSRETTLLTSGEISGGNERGRKAALDDLTIDERMIVGDCKLRQIMSQKDYDIAKDAVQLRRELLEIAGM